MKHMHSVWLTKAYEIRSREVRYVLGNDMPGDDEVLIIEEMDVTRQPDGSIDITFTCSDIEGKQALLAATFKDNYEVWWQI